MAFGVYPLGLELSVEATYPLDEATGTVLIFFSGQIQGAILVILSGFMAQDLSPYEATIEVIYIINSFINNFLTKFML